MPRQGSALWVVLMWTCYAIALGAVFGQLWWLVPIGWAAGTISAART